MLGSENHCKNDFLNMKMSTSTRFQHDVEQKHWETEFLKMKKLTSTRIGHVCERKPWENESFENENVDVNEDWACW